MSKPIRMGRRTWVAAWAVLCAAGLAATAALQDSSASQPRPAESVSAECAEVSRRPRGNWPRPGSRARTAE
ncbi:hypothetical protein [Streptomyces sp. PBSH9]|uniref:hypothetical protein n=1 Tax=Streptomyces sp. PBSH9 TaxID=2921353 RepID=UPI001FAD4E1F|nr:hypothetical protein [Streptomyces sp. PBSH9]